MYSYTDRIMEDRIDNCRRMMEDCDRHLTALYELSMLNDKHYRGLQNPNTDYHAERLRYEDDLAIILRSVNMSFVGYRVGENDLAVLSPYGKYQRRIEDGDGFIATIFRKIKEFFKWIWDSIKWIFGIKSDKQITTYKRDIDVKIKRIEIVRDSKPSEPIKPLNDLKIPHEITLLFMFFEDFNIMMRSGMNLNDFLDGPKMPAQFNEYMLEHKYYKAVEEAAKTGDEKKLKSELGVDRLDGDGGETIISGWYVYSTCWKEYSKKYKGRLQHSKEGWVDRLRKENRYKFSLEKMGAHNDIEVGIADLQIPVGIDLYKCRVNFIDFCSSGAKMSYIELDEAKKNREWEVKFGRDKTKHSYEIIANKLPDYVNTYMSFLDKTEPETKERYFDELEREMTQLADEARDIVTAKKGTRFVAMYSCLLKNYQTSARAALEAKRSYMHSIQTIYKAVNYVHDVMLPRMVERAEMGIK